MMRLTLMFSILFLLAACQQKEETGTTTKSGYPVTFHIDEEGPTPEVGQWVIFDVYMYRGDEIVNSTEETGRKATVKIEQEMFDKSIGALYESLLMLSEGDSVTVIQPLDTVENKPRGFEDYDKIKYDVQVENVLYQKQYEVYLDTVRARQEVSNQKLKEEHERIRGQVRKFIDGYNIGKLQKELHETENGVKYLYIKEGEGPKPKTGQTVVVHYSGFLLDGTNFDNSYDRGKPISFQIGDGRVIKGWDEGISNLKEGTQALLFIPPELAYGSSGYGEEIPPNSELVFFVSLENVSRL